MADQEIIQTKNGPIIDDIHTSPVDVYENTFRSRITWAVILLIVILAAYLIWFFTLDRTPQYADITEHFKYGSIGSEPGGSIFSSVGGVLPPYWAFKALPQVCPEKLPGGYASLGLIFEPGHDLPIGVARRHSLGIEQVGLNCAVCHTGTVRDSTSSEAKIVLGMPAHRFDIEGFFEFVLNCTLDERMTPDAVIAKSDGMSWREKLLYRTIVISRLKAGTLILRNRIAPLFI